MVKAVSIVIQWRLVLPILAALAACPVLSAAAQNPATLIGRVVDEETGDPVGDALVRVAGRAPLNADSLGRFLLTDLPAGELEVAVQALGYSSLSVRVHLQAGQALEQVFSLAFTGDRLPEVVVQARADRLAPRYSDFERRRARGMGAYFRWEEIKRRGFGSVGDALRTVRGVRIRCDQAAFECHAVMARTPQCFPAWWIDGMQVRSFHENTPIRDIYGIEVYRGPGEIPADFGGSTAACGVIVIWTKSRPYR